jgi:hypothetical protein
VDINWLDGRGRWLNDGSEFGAELYGPNVLTFGFSVGEVGAGANPANCKCLRASDIICSVA